MLLLTSRPQDSWGMFPHVWSLRTCKTPIPKSSMMVSPAYARLWVCISLQLIIDQSHALIKRKFTQLSEITLEREEFGRIGC